ncbi:MULTISPECIES: ABC transporter ATP-binding protein [unclassified Acetobacterium]|jgi:energy-coupling factor transport system ATP-binding protein|uniref:ABC transporter ATP-binding protein n=1 Tax=unclassified Acetobacterium TaxID=2638182 RepID=UPI000DBEC975|nr:MULTISPECIES: energy-coupling factor ABC transporter ATP-binding protein [unclassified Acetobacterium]AWW27868.1 ABC transporter [Acetobacterium sp. KB-1]MDZ5725786.1 energy-coupling factor ABC transporter ATP-binding protein [Acetobacterium sp. K1/6]
MIQLSQINFTYENSEGGGCLHDLNLTINRGEVILLCGGSGCGKTTLTRLINGLIPHFYSGQLSGEVLVNGKNVSQIPLYDTAELVGSVFQNPRSQFFNVDTTSELAFGCENMGLAADEIGRRIDDVSRDLCLDMLLERSIFALSGGQKQKIACGSVAALEPEIIVLDEPSSNLDAKATRELQSLIALWKSQGKTIVIAEHRLHYLQELADRVVLMDKGRIIKIYPGTSFSLLPKAELERMGLRILKLKSLYGTPLAVRPAFKSTFSICDFNYAYRHCDPCLKIANACLPKGAVIAVIGENGCGKTTFARCLCGLENKCSGTLNISGCDLKSRDRLKNCFMVMQDVNHQLFSESVLDELLISMNEENEAEALKILESLDLSELKDLHPMSLSGGQKQRVAIACAVASCRPFILFDEPTSGLDLKHMQQVATNIQQLSDLGKTQFVITHDPELILAACTHVLHLDDGDIKKIYPLDDGGVTEMLSFFIADDGLSSRVSDGSGLYPGVELLQPADWADCPVRYCPFRPRTDLDGAAQQTQFNGPRQLPGGNGRRGD